MAEDRVSTTHAGHVAIVRLADPATRNALDGDMQARLAEALLAAAADDDIRAIVLTGGDDLFASGADIRELARTDPMEVMAGRRRVLWDALADIRTPIVAGVAGHVLGGGCELTLACDLVVAGDTAVIGLPEIRLGIIPGAGGTQRWGRLAGRLRTAEHVLTGRTVDAWQALDLGLVNRVVPAQRTVAAAVALAQEVASMAPLAAQNATEALDQIDESPMTAAMDHDRALMSLLLSTRDATEGLTAFVERRRPNFEGR